MAQAAKPTLGELLLYLWRLSRPETWMVSVLPAYIGWVLATRELVPGLPLWTDFWQTAAAEGATFASFRDTFATWLAGAWPLLLALVVMGPLIWLPTLLWNDVHDLPGDRANPRKARSPLVQGLVTQAWAARAATLGAAVCLAVALAVGPAFAAIVAANLLLAWAYSSPPLRWKTRPGADVAVNAVGIGFLSGLAGWAIAAPLTDFPYLFVPQALLVAIAVYVPTTLVDHDADREAGYLTLATHMGVEKAYKVGWYSWVLCNLGALLLAWNGWIIPRAMLPILVVFVPLLLFEYHYLIGRAHSGPEMVKGVILSSLTFLCVNMVFALMYTGLWAVA